MKLRSIVLGAFLTLVVVAALIAVPSTTPAGAVANPGAVTIAIDRMSLSIGTNTSTFDAADAPGCSDGRDDGGDTDALVDYPADPQCAGPTDDSEVKAGSQARVLPKLTGTIAGDGTLSIPASGVTLPVTYLESSSAGGDGVVTASPVATHTVTGKLIPDTGVIEMRLRVSVRVVASALPSGCTIGTSAAPIDLAALRQSTSGGQAYDPASGTGAVADRTYSVPKSSGCGLFTAGFVDSALGLPSASGTNVAVFALRSTPSLQPGPPPTTTTASTLSTTTTTKPTTTTTTKPTTTTTTRPTTTTVPRTTTTRQPTTTTTTVARVATTLTATPITTPTGDWYWLTLRATLNTVSGTPVASASLAFTTNAGHTCQGTTSTDGVATCGIFVWGNSGRPAGYSAKFAGTTTRLPSTSAPVTISYT